MWDWLKSLPGKAWLYVASVLGGIVLFAAVYFSGRSVRKGDLEIELAKRELEKANRSYAESVKKTQVIQEKQKRLVSDILTEHMVRDAQAKRTKGLTDEQVLEELRKRGDIASDNNDPS
jgi:cell division FtsZ-interacting protein ZapD